MNLPSVLRYVGKNYPFHVYQSIIIENGYLLETNSGRKHLTLWSDPFTVEWAFTWREIMAQKGLRQLDRFIRTKESLPYLRIEDTYLVVQDYWPAESFKNTQKMKQEIRTEQLGFFVSLLYVACEEATQFLQKKKRYASILNTNQVSSTIGEKNRWKQVHHDLLKKESTQGPTLFGSLVESEWSNLRKRSWQAQRLKEISLSMKQDRCLPQTLSLDNWLYLENKYLYFTSNEQAWVPDFQSLSSLIKDVYQRHDYSLTAVLSFYEAFIQNYRPDLATQYNILAYLVEPQAFFKIIEKYVYHGYSDIEAQQIWKKHSEEQNKLDQLHLCLADYLDRGKEERILP